MRVHGSSAVLHYTLLYIFIICTHIASIVKPPPCNLALNHRTDQILSHTLSLGLHLRELLCERTQAPWLPPHLEMTALGSARAPRWPTVDARSASPHKHCHSHTHTLTHRGIKPWVSLAMTSKRETEKDKDKESIVWHRS
jgi:hypothetical protein